MVKRLRLSPLTAATRVRIPAESPKCASARCAFFHAGFQTRVRVLLCNPHPVHARVPRHFRVSSSPIGARCKANPGRVTITAHWYAPFLFAGILPGSPCFSQGATRCTPLCSALALRRGTTHVSGSTFAPFRASCRSHTGRLASFHSAQNFRKIPCPILRGLA